MLFMYKPLLELNIRVGFRCKDNVASSIAPIAGSLSGPVGSAVGTGLSAAMKGLSTYDNLKNEALGQAAL